MKLLTLVKKALIQTGVLGSKTVPVLVDLFFLMSHRLGFEVLNKSRESGKEEFEFQYVTYRLNVFCVFCLLTTFTESLYYECLQCGGGCRVKHDHSIKHFFPVSVGKE